MESNMVLPRAQGESAVREPEAGEPGCQEQEVSSDAPSPFIAGTQIQYAWDATSIGYLKRCPRLYQYSIIENWQAKSEGVHLRWGEEFHKAVETYERLLADGASHDDCVHIVLRTLLENIQDWDPDPLTANEEKKSKAALVRSVVWYLDDRPEDAAKTVILENGKPAVELSFSFQLDFGPRTSTWMDGQEGHETQEGQPYIICGHLDKIVEYQGDHYVIDYKTTTTTPGDYWFKQWQPENQMTLYTIAGQVLMQAPIKGVILDAIQVAVTFSRPVRGFTMRSGDELDEWLADLRVWLQQAESYAINNHWPMNDTACDKYGGCKFRQICSKPASVREKWLQGLFTQENERWNPLKPR